MSLKILGPRAVTLVVIAINGPCLPKLQPSWPTFCAWNEHIMLQGEQKVPVHQLQLRYMLELKLH